MVYDPLRDRFLLFGGVDENEDTIVYNDLFELRINPTPQWTMIQPAGEPPAARAFQTLVYDANGDRLLLFGGRLGTGQSTNDCWELSLGVGTAWAPLLPSGLPPDPIYLHTAVFDLEGNEMLVYGGAPASPVWALRFDGGPHWAQLIPQDPAPPIWWAPSSVYDAHRDRVVLHGMNTPLLNTTWEITRASSEPVWRELSTEGSDSRCGHTAFYDPYRDRMVVIAGADEVGNLNDVVALTFTDANSGVRGGVPARREDDHLSVWPNPASREIHVMSARWNVPSAVVSLYDAAGRFITSSVSPNETTFDLRGVPDGRYWIVTRSDALVARNPITVVR